MIREAVLTLAKDDLRQLEDYINEIARRPGGCDPAVLPGHIQARNELATWIDEFSCGQAYDHDRSVFYQYVDRIVDTELLLRQLEIDPNMSWFL